MYSSSNGHSGCSPQSRASELGSLLDIVIQQSIPFAQAADEEVAAHTSHAPVRTSSLVESHSPEELSSLLSQLLSTSSKPRGQDGFRCDVETILRYSANTMAPGFMDKLYSASVPPGIAADLVLSILNTNLHVYQVSPALTLIEKHVTKALASLFGLNGPRAGGINVQGGSASNLTSIVIARTVLYPRTKFYGNSVDGLKLVLFTSAHGHYSIEKAAMASGLGSNSVVPVPVDPVTGTMIPSELERLVVESRAQGRTPFYVNATAGTTVLGSFDSFAEIAAIARRHNMWFHIDGAWGGSFIFSDRLRHEKLKGCELADSIAINPHKMMGVPVTCSFLLAKDLKQFHDANTLRAGYLFHDVDDDVREPYDLNSGQFLNGVNGHTVNGTEDSWQEPNDLADMTLQCGRRGDSLKLFMAWRYYGTEGYREKIENAYEVTCHMANLVTKRKDFVLVSENPPPCLQVCYYYAPGGRGLFGEEEGQLQPPGLSTVTDKDALLEKHNSKVTERITRALVARGFMIDFAPAPEGQTSRGKFFRAVVNIHTPRETVERLVRDIEELGEKVVQKLRGEYRTSTK
jgi:glutamate decarboxylase